MKASDFFALPASLAPFAPFFLADDAPWEWVKKIAEALASQPLGWGGRPVPVGVSVEGAVFVHSSVKVPHTATFVGPAYIGAGTQIRPGAFIRGNVITGENCVLGNSCEFKNCLLLDRVQIPHFSYVGDSVLGNDVHFGAGVICSNLRLDQKPVTVRSADTVFETGMRKLGTIAGDKAEVGCNAVLNPGTVLGQRALVTPAISFSGYLPPAMIAKARQGVTLLPRRD